MKRFLLLILLLLAVVRISTAEQIEIRHVSELVQPASIIARVTIICEYETGAQEGYSRIAQARVTDSLSGPEVGSIFELENDAVNMACPNVRYTLGEDVLLFALRMPNGHHETLYAAAGKIPIENERVNARPFSRGQSYRSVRALVEREIRRIERGQS